MDIRFEPSGGRPPFPMKVWFFETIQQIKEKIQKYTRIPTEKQTLIFKNETLPDDLKIYQTAIIGNSHIQLIVAGDRELMPPPEEPTTVEGNQESTPASFTDYCTTGCSMENNAPTSTATASPSKKITLILRHSSFLDGYPMEFEDNDSIRGLKEKIYSEVHKGLPVEKVTVRSNGVELHDHNTLYECGLFDHCEIDVSFKRSPPANKNTPRIQKIPKAVEELKIMVLCGTETIALEVNESDNVVELRKELEKMDRREVLNLSDDVFFFKHKQGVMLEYKSFQWHNVRQGDTIEIIDGRVSH